ncbi:hypothetical protein YPPY63_4629, partial [Yersinia pestis PY-63]
MGSAGEP